MAAETGRTSGPLRMAFSPPAFLWSAPSAFHRADRAERMTIEEETAAAHREYIRRTPRSGELWEQARRYVPLGVHSNYRFVDPYPFYVARAQGVQLWDADGNAYLDFNMGFGALQSGHAHPKLVAALSDQLARGSTYGYEWAEAP